MTFTIILPVPVMAATRGRAHAVVQTCRRTFTNKSDKSFSIPKALPSYNIQHLSSYLTVSTKKLRICHHCCLYHNLISPWQPNYIRINAALSFRKQYCTSSPAQSSTTRPVLDPYHLVHKEMSHLCIDISKELKTKQGSLGMIARYYFDGQGKAFRPMVVLLMAKACNFHQQAHDFLLESQKKISMITEMLHTATLIHDDVIDASDARRGKASVNLVWGQRKAILAGDYILSVVSTILARIGNAEVVSIMSQVVEDLVRGEFMQLGSKEEENERFAHYLDKTFKKTASMLAASCKSVAVLGNCNEDIAEIVYQYGKNLGIAFQLVDDLLDFVSSQQQLGKPTTADLKLGLATAPVLFAAQQFPELNPLIMRRFGEEGDVERARELVAKSDGIEQTKMLAANHTKEAVRLLKDLATSELQQALILLTKKLLQRQK